MKREHFEVGVQRVYYVAWGLWLFAWCCAAVSDARYRLKYSHEFDIEEWVTCAVWAVLPPPVLMFAVRWIYRGFFPARATPD